MIELSRNEAQRFLLAKQGLIGNYQFYEKFGVLSFLNRVHAIQYDPVDLCGKNAEIVLHARVGAFQKNMLSELLYSDSELIESYDKKLCIVVQNDWSKLAPVRHYKLTRLKELDGLFDIEAEIMSLLSQQKTVCVKSFSSHKRCKWYWRHDASIYQIALERLFIEGKIRIASREGNIKEYQLNNLFSDKNSVPNDDYYKWHIKRRIESIGMLWMAPSPVWEYIPECTLTRRRRMIDELMEQGEIEEVCIDSVPRHLYCSRDDFVFLNMDSSTLSRRVEFLAPLDNLLWDRKLVSAIFNFKYTWEIYVPETKRQFCSYCLPILWGNDLVGRIDLKVDGTCLVIRNIWIEKPIDDEFRFLLKEKLLSFARFNSCDAINGIGVVAHIDCGHTIVADV